MKSLRSFLGLIVFSSTFLILSCASDQTPAKNHSSKNTADILNEQISILLNAQKAGHTGSLDPMATGVLPISKKLLG